MANISGHYVAGESMKKLFDLVIFGGTGDLSMRKLLPAMYRAYCQGDVDDDSRIIVCCRAQADFENLNKTTEDALRAFLGKNEFKIEDWESFSKIIHPVLINLVELDKGWDQFAKLFGGNQERVRLFYLAVMPSIYGACCENLSLKNLITPHSRIIVEKPLGYDFDSAEKINETMAKFFKEDQIYRIDHYLGKETVQNLLALRFNNFLFENIWDSKSIDHIQISIGEQVGLEGRTEFYDGAGAMRDMVQNHLLQLLSLIAMEPPSKLTAEDIRVEKVKVLRALKPLSTEKIKTSTVRGQYVSGRINDENVAGYLDELKDFESKTETFVAIRAFIANWRWAGVPFYLRTGKRMKHRSAEIIVEFKKVTHNVHGDKQKKLQPNRLVIQLQPDEKIQLFLMTKDLGSDDAELKPIALNLDYRECANKHKKSAYQRLLMDAINGNPTLFIHRDEVKAAWSWIDPIIEQWKLSDQSPELYKAGSWGPSKADDLFSKKDHGWINIHPEAKKIVCQ